MDSIGLNLPFLIAQILNLVLIVGHLALALAALRRLGRAELPAPLQLGWAFLIIFVPLLGSAAFLFRRNSAQTELPPVNHTPPFMRLEHIAFNVHDPAEVAAWYAAHLGMNIVRKAGAPLYPHFLADASGLSLLEFYHNPELPLPDYTQVDPYAHHIAFAVESVEGEMARLVTAGAVTVGVLHQNAAGDIALFLRDPWGLPLQLVQRREPLL